MRRHGNCLDFEGFFKRLGSTRDRFLPFPSQAGRHTPVGTSPRSSLRWRGMFGVFAQLA